jgi:hypothetical protein
VAGVLQLDGTRITDIAVQGDLAYLADVDSGNEALKVVDVSNLPQAAEVARHKVAVSPERLFATAGRLAVVGRQIGWCSVQVLDISDPLHIRKIGEARLPGPDPYYQVLLPYAHGG